MLAAISDYPFFNDEMRERYKAGLTQVGDMLIARRDQLGAFLAPLIPQPAQLITPRPEQKLANA